MMMKRWPTNNTTTIAPAAVYAAHPQLQSFHPSNIHPQFVLAYAHSACCQSGGFG